MGMGLLVSIVTVIKRRTMMIKYSKKIKMVKSELINLCIIFYDIDFYYYIMNPID